MMRSVVLVFILICASALFSSCATVERLTEKTPENKPIENLPVARSFAFPIGPDRIITQKRDKKDNWYNALDFREKNHLGEDWNKNTGGNTDCGEPVYAAAAGRIIYAKDAGYGWGNVIIVNHRLVNGKRVQTLYAHLRSIKKREGKVKRREQIGTIGNANGYYKCHLHFELRKEDSPQWNRVYRGYSEDSEGWLDPSDFIRANNKKRR